MTMQLKIPIDIVPQGRPRFHRGRAYDPPKSRKFKTDLATLIKTLGVGSALNGEVKVKMDIFRQAATKNLADTPHIEISIEEKNQ